ncbi:hypothetical protein TIFTF001_014157 [Ficus carica]|uniref:Uncharacterized protein n=1 Tax=Ficus carica TaxID=3494 RepID=A0AA88D7W8_FICCA|nr:hypothetical protein TIFTF001_014157 [Ficus carica]
MKSRRILTDLVLATVGIALTSRTQRDLIFAKKSPDRDRDFATSPELYEQQPTAMTNCHEIASRVCLLLR